MRRSDTISSPSPLAGQGRGEGARGEAAAGPLGSNSSEQASESTLCQLLFSPRSIALIGQSNDAGKTAGRPLKFLRQAGFAGRVYPVNARRDEVLGERAWPSLGVASGGAGACLCGDADRGRHGGDRSVRRGRA